MGRAGQEEGQGRIGGVWVSKGRGGMGWGRVGAGWVG